MNTDDFTRLEKLASLHRAGALSDAEFAAEKQKVLGSSSSAQSDAEERRADTQVRPARPPVRGSVAFFSGLAILVAAALVALLVRRSTSIPDPSNVESVGTSPAKPEQQPAAPSDLASRKVRCDSGDGDACFEVARFFESTDKPQSADYADRACKANNSDGCRWVASDLFSSTLKALALDEVAFLNAAQAQKLMDDHRASRAMQYLISGGRIDQSLCDAGNALACSSAALFYACPPSADYSVICPWSSSEKENEYWQRACDLGAPMACSALARNLPDGLKAASLFRRACDGGYADGCVALGWILERGKGIQADVIGARSAYKAACKLGRQPVDGAPRSENLFRAACADMGP